MKEFKLLKIINHKHETLLNYLAENDDENVLLTLKENSLQLISFDNDVDILQLCIDFKCTKSAFYLIQFGVNINHSTKRMLYSYDKSLVIDTIVSCTPLITSILNENIKIVSKLIEMNVELNPRNSIITRSPLYYAVQSRNYQIIELLLKNKANPNTIVYTPIGYAISNNLIEIVKLLLKYNADFKVLEINKKMIYEHSELLINAIEKNGLSEEMFDILNNNNYNFFEVGQNRRSLISLAVENKLPSSILNSLCRFYNLDEKSKDIHFNTDVLTFPEFESAFNALKSGYDTTIEYFVKNKKYPSGFYLEKSANGYYRRSFLSYCILTILMDETKSILDIKNFIDLWIKFGLEIDSISNKLTKYNWNEYTITIELLQILYLENYKHLYERTIKILQILIDHNINMDYSKNFVNLKYLIENFKTSKGTLAIDELNLRDNDCTFFEYDDKDLKDLMVNNTKNIFFNDKDSFSSIDSFIQSMNNVHLQFKLINEFKASHSEFICNLNNSTLIYSTIDNLYLDFDNNLDNLSRILVKELKSNDFIKNTDIDLFTFFAYLSDLVNDYSYLYANCDRLKNDYTKTYFNLKSAYIRFTNKYDANYLIESKITDLYSTLIDEGLSLQDIDNRFNFLKHIEEPVSENFNNNKLYILTQSMMKINSLMTNNLKFESGIYKYLIYRDLLHNNDTDDCKSIVNQFYKDFNFNDEELKYITFLNYAKSIIKVDYNTLIAFLKDNYENEYVRYGKTIYIDFSETFKNNYIYEELSGNGNIESGYLYYDFYFVFLCDKFQSFDFKNLNLLNTNTSSSNNIDIWSPNRSFENVKSKIYELQIKRLSKKFTRIQINSTFRGILEINQSIKINFDLVFHLYHDSNVITNENSNSSIEYVKTLIHEKPLFNEVVVIYKIKKDTA